MDKPQSARHDGMRLKYDKRELQSPMCYTCQSHLVQFSSIVFGAKTQP
jgi:hypothetical protein